MSEVQNTTQYLPELQHVLPSSVEKVKISPNNGTTFLPGQYVEFRVNPNSGAVLDNSKCRVSCTFEAIPVASTGAYNLYSSPSFQSAIEKLEIRVGQNLIEDITHYNRAYACLSRVYSSIYQTANAGSLTDLYEGHYFSNIGNQPSTGPLLNTGATANPPTTGAVDLCFDLSLSSLFGSGSKYAYPLHALKEPTFIRIYLSPSVNEVLYSRGVNATVNFGAGTTWKISNVSLDVVQVNYDFDEMKHIKSMMNEVNEYCIDQVASSTANIGYSSNEKVIMPNCSYSSVNSMIYNFWYNSYSLGSDATIGNSPGCGVFRSTVFINGVPLSSIKTGTANNSNPINSNSSLGASVLKLNRPLNLLFDSNTQLISPNGLGGSTTAKGNYNNINGQVNFGIPADGTQKPIVPIGASGSGVGDGDLPHPTGGCLIGFNLTTALDKDSQLKGRDLRGKQVVFDVDQSNTIVDSVLRTVQCVMNTSVKVILNVKEGSMRIER